MKHLLTLAIVLCLGAFTSAQIPSYVPTNGLVGWWPFNGNANDESGNGNHGTVNGATLAADRFGNAGKAYSFGGGSNISLPNQLTLGSLNGQITFSVWIKPNNIISSPGNGNTTFDLSDGNCDNCWGYRYSIIQDLNCFSFYKEGNQGGNGFRISSSSNLSPGNWYHLVGIISGSNAQLFLNGQLASSVTHGTTVTNLVSGSINSKMLGVRTVTNNQNPLNGLLDEFAIYNRALTAAEVQQLYTGQSACNLTVNLAPSDTLAACGNSVNLNAGNPGANYLWNTGDTSQSISATQSGWYGVTVTQNNCSATDSVYVNLLQVDLGNDTTVCRGRSLQLTSKSIGNINNPLRLPSDSASLKQLGYITGPQAGPNCTVHTETKWIKTLGVDSVSLFTVQHRFYDKSRIYNKQNQLIWEWAGESVPSTTWYGRKHQLYIGGNDSIRIEFYSGYPNFCVGSLSVTKLIFSTNYQSSTLWSTGDTTPTINVTPTQTTTYYCTVSDGISTCTDSVTVFVTQPPVLSLPDTLAACGNSVTLNAGNAGANFLWNTGDSTQSISATQSGWYSVTVNQNNCSATDSVYVNLLQVDLGNDTTVCRGNSISLSSGDFIGKTGPAGGIIFYDKQNNLGGWRYLELAPNDIGNAPWGCFGRVIGSTSDLIGFGDSNTRNIVQNCGTNTAAYLADNYVYNGFSDWYLPSILELEKIMQNVYQKGLGNFNASNGQYWSSTEAFSIGSKIISISNGSYNITDDNKQWSDYIRVCRKVNGTNATSTLWSTGDTTPTINVTPTQTTTYFCTVSDGISTCTDSVTVFVTQPPVLTLPDTLRSATRPVVLAPGNASSYRWSTGDSTANLSVNTAGTYSVTASNAAGCSSADSVLVLFSNPAPALPAAAAGMFNYQASVVSGGKPLANRSLSVRFTVADSTATNYSEIQQITTDARGHFATQVGAGSPISGSLSDVSWWDGLPRTLKTEVDTNGSGSWVVLGSSSLVAVPVSMYALRSGDGSRSIYGSFDSNGNVVSGRGFSVTPLGNGKFELVFQQPFTELPNVIVKLVGSGTYNDKIINRNTQKTTIEITGNPDQIQFEAKGK